MSVGSVTSTPVQQPRMDAPVAPVETLESQQVAQPQAPESTPESEDAYEEAPVDRYGLSNAAQPLSTGGNANGPGSPGYVSGVPTMDHGQQVCDPHLGQRPLLENGQWHGGEILNRLSQLDTMGGRRGTRYDESRCGPSSTLASAVMAGQDATAGIADRLASRVTNARDRRDLEGIRDRIRGGTATNDDLSRLQDAMLRRYAASPRDGMTTGEVSRMQRELCPGTQFAADGASVVNGGERLVRNGGTETLEHGSATVDRLASMRPGESVTMFVDTDRPGSPGHNNVNHFVQAGRDQDGRLYVYDPYPRANQPNLIYQDQNPAAFEHYTTGGMGLTPPGQRPVNVIAGGTVSHP